MTGSRQLLAICVQLHVHLCASARVHVTAHDLLVCYVVGCFVAAVGALVGGVVSLLLKWVSVGASLGSLLALWLILVDNGHFIVSETSIAIVCGASIAGCMVLSWYRTEVKYC